MRLIIVERKDILARTVGRHEANRPSRGAIHAEKGDISAATVFLIQIAQIIAAEGMGVDVADTEAEVVEEGVRAKDNPWGGEALIHQKKGQVQPRKKIKKKRKNHHQRAL